jgi:hypothetical protein
LLLILLLRSVRSGFSGRFGDHSLASQRKAEPLLGLRLACNFHRAVALARVVHRFVARRICRRELHRLWKNDDEVLGGIERPGIDLDLARVRQCELDLKLRFSRTQREVDRIAILLRLGHGVGADWLAIRRARLQLFDLGARRKIELEIVIIHLRLWRRRRVVGDEEAHTLHGSTVSLKANHVGGHAKAGDLGRDVVNVHVGRVDARRRHLMIGDSLMDGADEVRSGGSGELEAEFASAVGLGGSGHVHAAGEVDE